VKKLLKLLGLAVVVLLAGQGSADAVCRRCMVNRAGAVQNFDYGQHGAGSQGEELVCVRQVPDNTVVARKVDKQVNKQAGKQVGKLQAARARVAAWTEAAKKRMLEARVRVSDWAQAKAVWMRAKKQAIAAYIKARRPRFA
jgi:hypothetical protein